MADPISVRSALDAQLLDLLYPRNYSTIPVGVRLSGRSVSGRVIDPATLRGAPTGAPAAPTPRAAAPRTAAPRASARKVSPVLSDAMNPQDMRLAGMTAVLPSDVNARDLLLQQMAEEYARDNPAPTEAIQAASVATPAVAPVTAEAPMAAAMAPQETDPTAVYGPPPIAAAMAPASQAIAAASPVAAPQLTPGALALAAQSAAAAPSAAAPAPAAAPAADGPGVMDRIRSGLGGVTSGIESGLGRIDGRADRNAIYDGLIAAGAGLLGGKSLREGLSSGLAGFGDAYSARQKADREANKPKITPLADGAFSMIQFPDGTQKIVKNAEVAQYQQENETTKMTNALIKLGYGNQLQVQGAQQKADQKAASEYRPMLNQTETTLDSLKQARDIVGKQGIGAQIAGAVPGIAGFFGNDDVASNRFLQSLKVDATLAETARTKGAISDAEMRLFQSPTPNLTDDREKVWKPWIEQRIQLMEKLQKFYAGEVARGNAPAAAAPAPTGGVLQGGSVPAAARKYLD